MQTRIYGLGPLASAWLLIGCTAANGPPGQQAVDLGGECAPYAPLNGTASIALDGRAAPSLLADRSLLVTRRAGYASVAPLFTLGRQLKDLGNFVNYHECADRDGDKIKDLADFQRFAFTAGASDVDDHNGWGRVKVGTVPTIVNTFQHRILDAWPAGNDDGPFRLLAVVNRIDLAGDLDTRGGGQFAGAERRWFGEGRLIFGLDQDANPTTPYPMTLIMEYRLPALKESVSGDLTTYEIDPSFDPVAGPANNAAWLAGRARWAKIWRELSRYDQSDPRYQALLLKIVKLFATGDNHLALRTGERVTNAATNKVTQEFEYREFYLNDVWNLATRKMRREPIRCSQRSATLKHRIDDEWNPRVGDFHFTFMLGDRELESDEVEELSDLCGDGQYESPLGLPYGQDLNSGGFGLRAKFTRFQPTTVWLMGNEPELKRHKLAAASCSGCHAGETGNPAGFHVLPRLANADSELSPMLRGPVDVTPNGTKYQLDELADRTLKLTNFANRYNYSADYPLHEDLYCNASPCSATSYPE